MSKPFRFRPGDDVTAAVLNSMLERIEKVEARVDRKLRRAISEMRSEQQPERTMPLGELCRLAASAHPMAKAAAQAALGEFSHAVGERQPVAGTVLEHGADVALAVATLNKSIVEAKRDRVIDANERREILASIAEALDATVDELWPDEPAEAPTEAAS